MWKHDRLKAKEYKDQPVTWAHQKLDGHRVTVFKQPDGRVISLTPNDCELDLTPWPWYINLVRDLPFKSSVDAELWWPGHRASDIKTALIEHNSELRFVAFAMPWYRGIDCTTMMLTDIADWCQFHGIDFAPYHQWSPCVNYLAMAVGLDIEGWVFKQANYLNWYKYKPVKTIDLVVTGYTEGKGKNFGLIGSLKGSIYVSGELCEVANVGGFNDATRFELDEETDMDRVMEVAYQYVGNRGRLRHPRFVRFRDDKQPKECTDVQI